MRNPIENLLNVPAVKYFKVDWRQMSPVSSFRMVETWELLMFGINIEEYPMLLRVFTAQNYAQINVRIQYELSTLSRTYRKLNQTT